MSDRTNQNTDIDHETVLKCRKGDVEAFEHIVERHQKKMFNISYRITGDHNDAAEVVQDAFVAAFKNIREFRGRSRFSTWLYSIVVNLSKNRVKQTRTRSFREQLSLDDPVETDDGQIIVEPASNDLSVLEKLEKNEIAQMVQKCIDSLETGFREVIVLRDMQGFAYDEISDMLNTAAGTVKSRLHRAREAVKNCLKRAAGAL